MKYNVPGVNDNHGSEVIGKKNENGPRLKARVSKITPALTVQHWRKFDVRSSLARGWFAKKPYAPVTYVSLVSLLSQ